MPTVPRPTGPSVQGRGLPNVQLTVIEDHSVENLGKAISGLAKFGDPILARAEEERDKAKAAAKSDDKLVADKPAKGAVEKTSAKPKPAKPLKDAPAAKAPTAKAEAKPAAKKAAAKKAPAKKARASGKSSARI